MKMDLQRYRNFGAILLGTALLVAFSSAVALAEQQDIQQPILLVTASEDSQVVPTGCDGGSCCNDCCTESVCCPVRVEVEVKKHCWNVKTENVCIPGFRWPWECNSKVKKPSCGDCCDTGCDSCAPRCGRVRCVNVLEKHEYTCKKCGYEWKVKSVCRGNSTCDASNCCCPECGGQGCDY